MELSAILEALLVASDESLPAEELVRLVRARVVEAQENRASEIEDGGSPEELPGWLTALDAVTPEEVVATIHSLNEHYEQTGRAFVISERARGWRIFTRGEYGMFVQGLFPDHRPKRLSAPAMETLAIIAYRQPVTKSALEAVRGVSCDGMIQKLLDLELVRIGGRADMPGRPLLYETTDLFFEHFGIRSIDDLPNAQELRHVPLPEPPQPEAVHEEQMPLQPTNGNHTEARPPRREQRDKAQEAEEPAENPAAPEPNVQPEEAP